MDLSALSRRSLAAVIRFPRWPTREGMLHRRFENAHVIAAPGSGVVPSHSRGAGNVHPVATRDEHRSNDCFAIGITRRCSKNWEKTHLVQTVADSTVS